MKLSISTYFIIIYLVLYSVSYGEDTSVKDIEEYLGERLVYIENWKIDDSEGVSCPTGKDNLPDTQDVSSGTGIIVSEDTILTAFHVVNPEKLNKRSCFLIFKNGKDTSSPIIAKPSVLEENHLDPPRLVSGIQIGNQDLAFLKTGEAMNIGENNCIPISDVRPDLGDEAIQIGFKGKDVSILTEASFDSPEGEYSKITKSCILTNTCEFPDSKLQGMSGGPVLNKKGHLIGIMIQSDSAEDISIFEPLADIRPRINQIRSCTVKPKIKVTGKLMPTGQYKLSFNLINVPNDQIPISVKFDYEVEKIDSKPMKMNLASMNGFYSISSKSKLYKATFGEDDLLHKKSIIHDLRKEGSYLAGFIDLELSIHSPMKNIEAELKSNLTFYNHLGNKVKAEIIPSLVNIKLKSVTYFQRNFSNFAFLENERFRNFSNQGNDQLFSVVPIPNTGLSCIGPADCKMDTHPWIKDGPSIQTWSKPPINSPYIFRDLMLSIPAEIKG